MKFKPLVWLALFISIGVSAQIIIDDIFIPVKRIEIKPQPEQEVNTCIDHSGSTGQLKSYTIPTQYPGRITIGDLDADSYPEFVVSNRNRITAYSVCDGKLWDVPASTNWDVAPIGTGQSEDSHPYWNWSSYGYVGDSDNDGVNEFHHIGANWRTLYIRDGLTGAVKRTINLGAGKWMYVQVSKDGIFVSQSPGHLAVKAFNHQYQQRWSVNQGYIRSRFLPPAMADIDQDGFDDIVQSTLAISGRTGSILWKKNFGSMSTFGLGAHTSHIADINPSIQGLETSYTIYAPLNNQPSIIIVDRFGREYRNYNNSTHSHQHTVGDFRTDKSGLEILARHGDGKSHWLIDKNGNTIQFNVRVNPALLNPVWGKDWGFDGNELVQAIEWDDQLGSETLYTERHMNFTGVPMLTVLNHINTAFLTRAFHGGIDVPRRDTTPGLFYTSRNSWYGWINRANHQSDNDGPYEGSAHVADVFGDGREEVITLSPGAITIYFNSGNAGVPRRWPDDAYRLKKKLWAHVYNPR